MATNNKNPFKGLETQKSEGQTFDKDITFTLGGKEQSIYAYTQAARVDTEIYPTLEKYGCLDKITRPINDIYGDAEIMKDLRGTMEDKAKAEKIWNGIPLEIRQKFNNNPDDFIKNGMDWAKKEMEKLQPKQPEVPKSDTTNTQEN